MTNHAGDVDAGWADGSAVGAADRIAVAALPPLEALSAGASSGLGSRGISFTRPSPAAAAAANAYASVLCRASDAVEEKRSSAACPLVAATVAAAMARGSSTPREGGDASEPKPREPGIALGSPRNVEYAPRVTAWAAKKRRTSAARCARPASNTSRRTRPVAAKARSDERDRRSVKCAGAPRCSSSVARSAQISANVSTSPAAPAPPPAAPPAPPPAFTPPPLMPPMRSRRPKILGATSVSAKKL